jgi:(E)-4-hydroxy-3-methylbut-2-enyl-diphosphate synthase
MNPEPRHFDMDTVVSEVEKRLAAYDDLIEVSVLGSAGRGIGEARHADFGITGAKDSGIVYARGQPLKKVPTEELVEELFSETDKYYAAGKKLIVNDAQAAQAARWLSENEDETAI